MCSFHDIYYFYLSEILDVKKQFKNKLKYLITHK
jgi:hypothetical protein